MDGDDRKASKVLSSIDKFLAQEHLEKLCFLAETVLPYGAVEKADSIHVVQRTLESHTPVGRNGSFVLLKRFLESLCLVRFGKEISTLIDPNDHYTFPSLDKLYLYEIVIMVCDNLGRDSFKRLKNRIPDSQLGAHRDRVTTPIQLFKRLLEQQTLSVSKEKDSLELLSEWLEDIGRVDIVQQLKEHPRPKQEQGTKLWLVSLASQTHYADGEKKGLVKLP